MPTPPPKKIYVIASNHMVGGPFAVGARLFVVLIGAPTCGVMATCHLQVGTEIVAPVLAALVRIEGANNVSFSGITFTEYVNFDIVWTISLRISSYIPPHVRTV